MRDFIKIALWTTLSVIALADSVKAATDGSYNLSELTSPVWEGTDASLLKPTSADYNYFFGDEEYLTYTLPTAWQFKFYGQTYSNITVDSNGNIWFGSARSAHNFVLPNAGFGPVSATWNNDLSSLYGGGVFIQHLTSPERVVIEWQTETLTDEGISRINNFEVVLFDNSIIRYDYKPFTALSVNDSGSGISDDNTHSLSVTSNYGSPTSYVAPRSFLFTPVGTGNNLAVNLYFPGTGSGMVTSNPGGIACNTDCSAPFTSGTQVTLQPAASMYSIFTGWSGGGCSGTGNCVITPSSDISVTATFTYDVAHQVQVSGGSTTYYSSLQSAYNATADGSTIKLWATTYNESITCNRPITVTLQGGYNSDYTAIVGDPVLVGGLTVIDGTLVADGVVVQ